MSDETLETEIRLYLIGDHSVGKKSIVKRFKTLNCSKTNEHFEEEEEKKNKKKEKKKEKKEENEKEDNNEMIIKKKEEKPKELSFEEKKTLANEKIRLSLMKFTKDYTFGQKNISLHFFPCLEARQVSFDYEPKENDEEYDLVKNYKITLKTTKQEIQYYFNLPGIKKNISIEHLFLFVFDLKDFSSFEKICVYFEELNKKFLISSNFKYVLIGNKMDQKKNFSNEEKEIFNSFISKYNIKYYEISTLSFFHFETFFENLFKEQFTQILNGNSYEKKLHDLLTNKGNFSKSEKSLTRIDSTPGPDKYNSNKYDLPKIESEFRNTFMGKNRFNNHIFINKIGPLFPLIKKDYDKDFSHSLKKQSKTSYNQVNTWNSNIKKEIKDSLELNCDIPGFSLGMKFTSNLDLRKTRRDLKYEMNKKLDDAFGENNIRLGSKSPPKFKYNDYFEKYALLRKENYKSKIDEMKKQEEYIKELHDEVIKKNEKERKNLIDKIKEKEEKYDSIYKQRELDKEKNRTFYKNKVSTSRLSKDNPVPKMYDIRGKFDNKKGFTFGGKFKFNENKNKPDPDFNIILGDFDKIILKSKKMQNPNQTFEERFFTPKIEQPGDPSKIFEKLNKYKLNKINYLKDNASNFFDKRKLKKEQVLKRKREIEIQREEDLQNEIERQIALTGENFLLRDINYNLVEDSSPKFTMKGKYDDNKFKFKDYENEENLSNLNLINPNIAIVRPSLPSYSFGKSERFEDLKVKETLRKGKKNNNNNNNNNIINEEEELNNYFNYDSIGYQNIKLNGENYMGTARKDTILKDNGVPGPGYYWIKGFADIVKEKGDKVNEVRTRIREKELREKMGNVQEEKKTSVEKINDDEDNYYDNDIQGNELGDNKENIEEGNKENIEEGNKENVVDDGIVKVENAVENQQEDNNIIQSDNVESKPEENNIQNENNNENQQTENVNNNDIQNENNNENQLTENVDNNAVQNENNNDNQQTENNNKIIENNQEEEKKENIEKTD